MFKKIKTIMLKEVIKNLNIKKNGIYVDGTFGLGGHSKKILLKLGKGGRLYSFDRDWNSFKIGKKIKDSRFIIKNKKFSNLLNYFKNIGIIGKIDGIILDLGISKFQLKKSNRGFTFKKNEPLDMRMNNKKGITASEWLSKASKNEIYNVLKLYGEEKYSKKISNGIYNFKKKILNTDQLNKIIINNIPKKNKYKHPSKRVFLAIRIYINKELLELEKFLNNVLKLLNKFSTLLIITFNSLEDKMVKYFFKNIFNNHKKILPSIKEIKKNINCKSAILRIFKKK